METIRQLCQPNHLLCQIHYWGVLQHGSLLAAAALRAQMVPDEYTRKRPRGPGPVVEPAPAAAGGIDILDRHAGAPLDLSANR